MGPWARKSCASHDTGGRTPLCAPPGPESWGLRHLPGSDCRQKGRSQLNAGETQEAPTVEPKAPGQGWGGGPGGAARGAEA